MSKKFVKVISYVSNGMVGGRVEESESWEDFAKGCGEDPNDFPMDSLGAYLDENAEIFRDKQIEFGSYVLDVDGEKHYG